MHFSCVFLEFLGFKRTVSMRVYRLTNRCNGEDIEVNADTVERVTSVEISYIDWAIGQEGKFENEDWSIVEL